MMKAFREITEAAWDYLNGSGPDAGPRIEQAAIFATDALAYMHHEDCDRRNAHIAGDEHECNLDCEATAMQVPHLTREELFQCIIGLERLRDDERAEAKRYAAKRAEFASPEFADQLSQEANVRSIQAENLRQRLKGTPNYRPGGRSLVGPHPRTKWNECQCEDDRTCLPCRDHYATDNRVTEFEEETIAGYRVTTEGAAQVEIVADWNDEHDIPNGADEMERARRIALTIAAATACRPY